MKTHIISISIILVIYILISLGCIFIVYKKLKKANLNNSKNFRKDIRTAFANSFYASSIFSIIVACIIYFFEEKILEKLNFDEGIINYCMFITKIWFISAPFIGLQFSVFGYYISLDYWKKILKIIFSKILVYIILCFIYYKSKKYNCFIYAKTLCDFIFMTYYSKICFDITLTSH